MGVELEIVPTAWDGIIPALLAKKFDIIISGMYITSARNLQVNFTQYYDRNGLDLVANRELAGGMKNISDFNRPDVIFSLRRGTYPVAYVKKTLPQAQIKQFDDDASARQEVLNGRAHAWITAEPQPRFSALDYPDKLFQPIAERLTYNQQGMALRKGDIDALNFFNNWIAIKKQSGWLQERHEYWFGGREWAEQVGDNK
jgi:polar amino acid transport system substrate-binding protein